MPVEKQVTVEYQESNKDGKENLDPEDSADVAGYSL